MHRANLNFYYFFLSSGMIICQLESLKHCATAWNSVTHTEFRMIYPHRLLVFSGEHFLPHSWHDALDPQARLNEFTGSTVFQHSTLNTICCARVQPTRKSKPCHLILKPRRSAPPSSYPPAPPLGVCVFRLGGEVQGIESVQSLMRAGYSILSLFSPFLFLPDDLCSLPQLYLSDRSNYLHHLPPSANCFFPHLRWLVVSHQYDLVSDASVIRVSV